MTTDEQPQGVDGDVEPEVVPGNQGNVIHASKLMRIASMTRAMLEEARQAPVDELGRRRLVEVHERTIGEMEDILPNDLRLELQEVFLPLSSDTASESELRIAQAQLVGWLEGLFAGIQATLWSQQAAAASQLEQMRMRAIEAQGHQGEQEAPGQYL